MAQICELKSTNGEPNTLGRLSNQHQYHGIILLDTVFMYLRVLYIVPGGLLPRWADVYSRHWRASKRLDTAVPYNSMVG